MEMASVGAEAEGELEEDSDNVITVDGMRFLVTKPEPKEKVEPTAAAAEKDEDEDNVNEPVGEECEPFPKKNDPNPMLPADPLQYPYLLLPMQRSTAIRECTHPSPLMPSGLHEPLGLRFGPSIHPSPARVSCSAGLGIASARLTRGTTTLL